jgi:hypothetical protein
MPETTSAVALIALNLINLKLQEIQEAHRILERGGLSGKIVLVP